MIFVNFKTYREASGESAVNLAQICAEISSQTNAPIIPVVQLVDLWRVKQEVDIPVWVQHVDYHPQGSFTGSANLEAIYEAGAEGTLLNHSEHPIDFSILQKTVEKITQFQNAFKVMACAADLEKLKHIYSLKPDFIAYEPPELIGSETASVASEKQTIISEAAGFTENIPLIVGAGVKSAKDVRISLERGAKGVLVASAIVKSEDPEQKIIELAQEFKNK